MDSELAAYLDEAASLAARGVEAGHGGPFGAVVVYEGRVVGRGNNRVLVDLDPTAHAEIVAIRAACRELGRFSLDGCLLVTSCEPCPMCLAASLWARIERLVHAATRADAAAAGFDDALFYREMELPASERMLRLERVDHAPSVEAFARWRNKADRVAY